MDYKLRAFATYWRFRPRVGALNHNCGDSCGIRFVEKNAIDGHSFVSWPELEECLDQWVSEVADRQSDPDGIEAPIDRFTRAEVQTLQSIDGRYPLGDDDRLWGSLSSNIVKCAPPAGFIRFRSSGKRHCPLDREV